MNDGQINSMKKIPTSRYFHEKISEFQLRDILGDNATNALTEELATAFAKLNKTIQAEQEQQTTTWRTKSAPELTLKNSLGAIAKQHLNNETIIQKINKARLNPVNKAYQQYVQRYKPSPIQQSFLSAQTVMMLLQNSAPSNPSSQLYWWLHGNEIEQQQGAIEDGMIELMNDVKMQTDTQMNIETDENIEQSNVIDQENSQPNLSDNQNANNYTAAEPETTPKPDPEPESQPEPKHNTQRSHAFANLEIASAYALLVEEMKDHFEKLDPENPFKFEDVFKILMGDKTPASPEHSKSHDHHPIFRPKPPPKDKEETDH